MPTLTPIQACTAALITITAINANDTLAQTANMQVSVAKDEFNQGFAGPMIVQVTIDEPDLNNLVERTGMPDVNVQGRILNMAQQTDGKWVGFFAALNPARSADQAAHNTGIAGLGLDFGVFVANDTPVPVYGQELHGIHPDFTDTDGVALPQSAGLTTFANGTSPAIIPTGTGSLTGSTNLNNVVRNPPALNLNSDPAVPAGQIGLDENAWPNIQLFDLPTGEDAVNVTYNVASGAQILLLDYNQLPTPTITLDKAAYDPGDHVLLTIRDPQLNIDPTSPDSWTFNVTGPTSTFYQAFNPDGSNSANNSPALSDLNTGTQLDDMQVDNRGTIAMTLTPHITLDTNTHQPLTTATDGTTNYNNLLTLLETGPNTGDFTSFDPTNQSILRIAPDAPLNTTVATIQYAGLSIPIKTIPEPTTLLSLTAILLTTINTRHPTQPKPNLCCTNWSQGNTK